MDKEKQIEEMTKVLTTEECGDCCTCGFSTRCNERLCAKALYDSGYRKQDEIAEEVLEKVKEMLNPTMSALFIIGEILVDESKSHISQEKALDDIREELGRTISSRYRLEKMLGEIKKEYCEK